MGKMKMKFLIMYFLCSIILIESIYSLSNKHKSRHRMRKLRKQYMRPNVHDIKRFLKPMIAPPSQAYHPTMVDSLQETNKMSDVDMLHAEILGVQEKSTGVNENPSIYESVVSRHRTSIERPSFGKGKQIGLNVGAESMNNFVQGMEMEKLRQTGQGKIAIPVKLEMNMKKLDDPTMSRYENPSFLTTKEKKKKKGPKTIHVPKMPMITPNLQATSKKDIKRIKKKLDAAKSKKQKLKALKFTKNLLKKDAKEICDKIKKEIGKVLGAKKTAIDLSSTLNKYTLQIKKDNAKKLKLTDRISVKKQLKSKIFREVEGFRDEGKKYPLIYKVDKGSMKKIVSDIKNRLGF